MTPKHTPAPVRFMIFAALRRADGTRIPEKERRAAYIAAKAQLGKMEGYATEREACAAHDRLPPELRAQLEVSEYINA